MKRYAQVCFGVLMCLATSPLFAQAAALTLYTSSSEPFEAYVDGPKNAAKGVVLVHDWFGVSPDSSIG